MVTNIHSTGHTDTLEVAVRRCVLTGVNQTSAKLQVARMDEMGCEFVELTAHEGARPGKQGGGACQEAGTAGCRKRSVESPRTIWYTEPM